jgi:hypothetical protein
MTRIVRHTPTEMLARTVALRARRDEFTSDHQREQHRIAAHKAIKTVAADAGSDQ